MAKTPDAKRRASFGRAARLRDGKADSQPKAAKGKKGRTAKEPALSPRGQAIADNPRKSLAGKAATAAGKAKAEKPIALMKERPDKRPAVKPRAAFIKAGEPRAADLDAREDRTHQALRRVAEIRNRDAKRADDRRRERIKKDFATAADRRRSAALRAAFDKRQALLKDAARKAAADIEKEHKRQRDERQANDRRETDAMRNRHRRERQSFRDNELTVIARHRGTINRLDKAEQRDLADLAGKHQGIMGRVASLRPGGAKKQKQERQAIRDQYQAERLTKHRDLEAFKERQFQSEQSTRLAHARERLAMIHHHREGRLDLEREQEAAKPRLIEDRQKALAATHEQEQSKEQTQPHEKAPVRELAPEFNRPR